MNWYVICGVTVLLIAPFTRNVALGLVLVAGGMISLFIGVVALPALGVGF